MNQTKMMNNDRTNATGTTDATGLPVAVQFSGVKDASYSGGTIKCTSTTKAIDINGSPGAVVKGVTFVGPATRYVQVVGSDGVTVDLAGLAQDSPNGYVLYAEDAKNLMVRNVYAVKGSQNETTMRFMGDCSGLTVSDTTLANPQNKRTALRVNCHGSSVRLQNVTNDDIADIGPMGEDQGGQLETDPAKRKAMLAYRLSDVVVQSCKLSNVGLMAGLTATFSDCDIRGTVSDMNPRGYAIHKWVSVYPATDKRQPDDQPRPAPTVKFVRCRFTQPPALKGVCYPGGDNKPSNGPFVYEDCTLNGVPFGGAAPSPAEGQDTVSQPYWTDLKHGEPRPRRLLTADAVALADIGPAPVLQIPATSPQLAIRVLDDKGQAVKGYDRVDSFPPFRPGPDDSTPMTGMAAGSYTLECTPQRDNKPSGRLTNFALTIRAAPPAPAPTPATPTPVKDADKTSSAPPIMNPDKTPAPAVPWGFTGNGDDDLAAFKTALATMVAKGGKWLRLWVSNFGKIESHTATMIDAAAAAGVKVALCVQTQDGNPEPFGTPDFSAFVATNHDLLKKVACVEAGNEWNLNQYRPSDIPAEWYQPYVDRFLKPLSEALATIGVPVLITSVTESEHPERYAKHAAGLAAAGAAQWAKGIAVHCYFYADGSPHNVSTVSMLGDILIAYSRALGNLPVIITEFNTHRTVPSGDAHVKAIQTMLTGIKAAVKAGVAVAVVWYRGLPKAGSSSSTGRTLFEADGKPAASLATCLEAVA